MDKTFVYKRNLYENHLAPWIDRPLIKIITGMRRVGKSCLLRQLMDQLLAGGVSSTRIHLIDKESVEFDSIVDYRDLVAFLKKEASGGKGKRYLLIDEVQEIDQWEKAINSFLKSGQWDIYLTGSNAHMLSSELATLLSGRYVEIPVYTLSLAEFLQFNEKDPAHATEMFPRYLQYGGFPAIHQFLQNEDTIYQYINSLYDTIVLKDIVNRHSVRNVPLFQNISRYVFDNIGNTFSAKKVADYLKSQRLTITVDTVQKYLGFLTETFALHRVQRYDIKGKRILEIHEKYYLGDIGLRNAVLGYRQSAINGLLENVVFLELKRRGYTVTIGKFDSAEVDFIATKNKEKQYLQVCYLLASESTIKREFDVLAALPDNFPKTVLSMDPIGPDNREGIQWKNIISFLMDGEEK